MPSWPSQLSLRQPRQKAESSKDRDTPVSDRISFKRLFGDSISDSEEDEDTLRSPDISIHEPPVTSTPKRLVTSETVREYDVVDKAAQTDTYTQFRMGVEVGGRLFVTSRDTLKKHPTSRLAMLVDSKPTYIQDGLPVLFIDCDTQFFKIILHFCRDGHRNIHSHLTPVSLDKSILKQIEYYRLDSLTDIIISSQLSVLLMGHKEFLEE